MAKVEIGVLLPTREAVMSGRFETAPLLRMAEQVEALGYDSVWVGDSLLARPRFEPLTLLAAGPERAGPGASYGDRRAMRARARPRLPPAASPNPRTTGD